MEQLPLIPRIVIHFPSPTLRKMPCMSCHSTYISTILGYVCCLLISPSERKSNATFGKKGSLPFCCVSLCVAWPWRRGASVFHSHRFIANNTYMFTSMQACVCVLLSEREKRRSKRGK